MKKNLLIRALSGVIAIGILGALHYFLGKLGIQLVILFSVLIGAKEISRLFFKDEASLFLKASFYVLCLGVFICSATVANLSGLSFSLALIILSILSLLALHKTGDLDRIVRFQTKAAMGLFYAAFLPSFAYRILEAQNGVFWFMTLLLIVFAGDTFAYAFGVLFGKHKLMPHVSPKKSLQGSLGGLLGSACAGALCQHYFLPEVSLLQMIPLALIAGICAQFGDFCESLFKRVAGVKDSGRIMPGHGGILDRIDGVLFAAPVVFLGIVIFVYLH